MHPKFRQNLELFGAIAKDHMRIAEDGSSEKKRLDAVLDWSIDKQVKRRESQEDAQREIYELQKRKQEIMQWLKEEIALLDDEKSYEKTDNNGRRVTYDRDRDRFLCAESGGKEHIVTAGEIMTDGDWGIEYALDPRSVPRNVRKRYLIEKAKRMLQQHLDRQILVDEISSRRTERGKLETYRRVLSDKEQGIVPSGLIAEKMVENFLKKLTYDYDIDLEILGADVSQDVEHKVDFIIHRKNRYRGVGVREDSHGSTIGIQFTTNPDPIGLSHKRRQIEKVKRRLTEEDYIEDLVLVSLPIKDTRALYNRWNVKKQAGGPDRLWDPKVKERIFKEVVKNILTQEEIERGWADLARDLP